MCLFGTFSPRLRGRQRFGLQSEINLMDRYPAEEIREARDRGATSVTGIDQKVNLSRLVEDLQRLGVLPPEPPRPHDEEEQA